MYNLKVKDLIEAQSDGDFNKAMQSMVKSGNLTTRSIAYYYLTSGMSCLELQKYYNFVGGWE